MISTQDISHLRNLAGVIMHQPERSLAAIRHTRKAITRREKKDGLYGALVEIEKACKQTKPDKERVTLIKFMEALSSNPNSFTKKLIENLESIK